jgi:hypothetical protein
MSTLALDLMGRSEEAAARLRAMRNDALPTIYRLMLDVTIGVLEGNRTMAIEAGEEIMRTWRLRDPCAVYYMARTMAAMEHPRAIEMLRRAVEGGFHASFFFRRDPWLDPIRSHREFRAIIEHAEKRRREAAQAYVAADGERILGPVHRA